MTSTFIHFAVASCIVLQTTTAFFLSPLPSAFTTTTNHINRSPPLNMSSSNNKNANALLLSKIHQLTIDGPHRLILASQSPRRREILDMMGLTNKYTVTFSPLDEEALQIELRERDTPISPMDYARKLAESKAYALAEDMMKKEGGETYDHESSLILGSDTIVDKDGSILEKPKSEDDAKRMLEQLSGSWHEVHTGVALYRMTHKDSHQNAIELISSFTETAKVKFCSLSSQDIDAYVQTGEPMDKAGSYGIQGIGGQMVERMDGDFFAVMGLPMHRLSQELAKAL
jgi:septum formation protein